jgi:hypothetical protein
MTSEASPAPADEVIECQTYTHARRFPLVVGQIAGYYLPVPWTPAQLVTALGTLVLLLWSRRAWGHFGAIGNVMILLGAPLTLSWLVRHLRIEGRNTTRAVAGFVRYLTRSRSGKLHGRPVMRARAHHDRAARVFATQSAPTRLPSGHIPWNPSLAEMPQELAVIIARSKGS